MLDNVWLRMTLYRPGKTIKNKVLNVLKLLISSVNLDFVYICTNDASKHKCTKVIFHQRSNTPITKIFWTHKRTKLHFVLVRTSKKSLSDEQKETRLSEDTGCILAHKILEWNNFQQDYLSLYDDPMILYLHFG